MSSPDDKEIIDVECIEVPLTEPCISPLVSPSQGSVSTDDKNLTTDHKRKHTTDTSVSNSSPRLKMPALSSKASKEDHITFVLNDQSLYMDDEEFFRLIQEDGFSSNVDQHEVKIESLEQSHSKRNYSRNVYKDPTSKKNIS